MCDSTSYAYEPTILTGVEPGMYSGEETFGPVVAVYPVATEADAIAAANDDRHGLNASVWSRDARRGRAVAAQLRTGSVNVNEAFGASFASLSAPMGGMGESGLGRRQGLPKGCTSHPAADRRHPARARLRHAAGAEPGGVRRRDDGRPARAQDAALVRLRPAA